jgi:hypothetical protein
MACSQLQAAGKVGVEQERMYSRCDSHLFGAVFLLFKYNSVQNHQRKWAHRRLVQKCYGLLIDYPLLV